MGGVRIKLIIKDRIRDAVRLVVHDDERTIGEYQQEPAPHADSAT